MPESLSLAPGGCRSGFNGVMQVVHSALEYFEDGSLQHHILHVLHGLALDETSGPQSASGGPQSDGEDKHSRFAEACKTMGTHLVSIRYGCSQMIS